MLYSLPLSENLRLATNKPFEVLVMPLFTSVLPYWHTWLMWQKNWSYSKLSFEIFDELQFCCTACHIWNHEICENIPAKYKGLTISTWTVGLLALCVEPICHQLCALRWVPLSFLVPTTAMADCSVKKLESRLVDGCIMLTVGVLWLLAAECASAIDNIWHAWSHGLY